MKGIVAFLMIASMSITACGAEKTAMGKAPDVEVSQQFQYYDVTGDTADGIRRQMSENGTKWDDGNTYDSLTTWNLNWNYDYDCTGHRCTVSGFKTTVNIVFRYPKWIKPADAPASLVTQWDTYMKHLITHENGHRDLAVQAATSMTREADMLPAASSPAELDKEVQALTAQDIAKLNADEKQYDVTTIHGTTQGAVFP